MLEDEAPGLARRAVHRLGGAQLPLFVAQPAVEGLFDRVCRSMRAIADLLGQRTGEFPGLHDRHVGLFDFLGLDLLGRNLGELLTGGKRVFDLELFLGTPGQNEAGDDNDKRRSVRHSPSLGHMK